MGVEEILVKLFRHWRPSPRPTPPGDGKCGANTFGGGHAESADCDDKEKINIPKKKLLIVSFLAAVVVVALFFGLYYGLRERELQIENNRYGGVSTNGLECAQIGADILKQGGSAADAAIAALFCEGVACPQSMGLGGGFLMTIYNKDTGLVETVNARETAPALATEDMFVGNAEAAVSGGLAIAVPGELKGYWEVHQKYGKLPWRDLVEPTIKLCQDGHEVSGYLARILDSRVERIRSEPTLAEVYINPITQTTWQEGDRIKRLKLAASLEIIAAEGANALYSRNGTLLGPLLADIKSINSILVEDDFINYKVEWGSAVETVLVDDQKLYTIPLPGTGAILTFMLDLIKGYKVADDGLTYHRITEAMKFGYAKRTHMGDTAFVPGMEALVANLTSREYIDAIRGQIDDARTFADFAHYGAYTENKEDHGTAHISVLAPNGDAVAVTSTINYVFGAFYRSPSTGIIVNDEMDDFSIPGTVNAYGLPSSPANYIVPGKRPLSSMTPTIVVDRNGDVQMVIGGAGGSKITTSVAYTIVRHLYLNETIEEAIHAKRIHHQLAPMYVQHEQDFPKAMLDDLLSRGHVLQESPPDAGFAALTALARNPDGRLVGVFDHRRGGAEVTFKN